MKEKTKTLQDLQDPFIFENYTGYLPGSQSAVLIKDSRDMFAKPDADPKPIPVKVQGVPKNLEVVPWGEDNDLPQQIISKVDKSPDLSTGLLFNIQVGFGEGIIPCKKLVDDDGKIKVIPWLDHKEVNQFFEDNDINGYFLEQLTDFNHFFNLFPEIILNKAEPEKRKVVQLTSKEAAFSRWAKANEKTNRIEWHLYSSLWDSESEMEEGDVVATRVLDFKRPIPDLLKRIGRSKGSNDEKGYRYIIPINFPTPGRSYYQKPYWYSIIESGWYDFAAAIPEFKRYLIKNGMLIKNIIYLPHKYFDEIFQREGITDKAKQKARVKKEFDDFNKFIYGLENTGKSMISFYKESADGKKTHQIEVVPIKNEFKGGEYLEDSGEVSNMMAYTMGVHPSIIGATPGKNQGSFSGTDKRELFIIKQTLLKPFRDRILKPLYLIKRINGWPDDMEFTIPNLELTTLDKNKTGTEIKTS